MHVTSHVATHEYRILENVLSRARSSFGNRNFTNMAYVARRLARCGVYSWRRELSARLLSSRPDGSEGVVERSEGPTGEVEVVRADQLVSAPLSASVSVG